MAESPFNRSKMTQRSPPPAPEPAPREPDKREDDPPAVAPTSEIRNFLTLIEKSLNDVCTISSDGKLNSEQKLRIQTLCRKVYHATSQVAVEYQSLSHKTIQLHTALQAQKEQQNLSQQLQDLKQSMQKSPNLVSTSVSFADVIKKGPNNYIQATNQNSVAIYPSDKTKSSEDTKALVQKIIRPEEMKLQVRGLRKTKNGGVVISTDTKDDIVKLKQSTQLTTSGLTVDDPQKRKPRIVIIGVPACMQETEVFKCIYHQNVADKLQGMSIENFLSSVKLSHKSGKREAETCNYVIEVPGNIRKALITKERIFINWSSCPVRDFTTVTRCYKCHQYGHAAKSCREAATTCGHCGETGHGIKECTKKSDPAKCATCHKFRKPHNHNTGDPDCPAKKMAEKRYINSIDYEGA
ncbi:uncharacterized protein [Choristoneura fumiferana]|uniref:uncharacterized protein n=1 Tax=Choristoneura fumiferana TaxID=7141 RepID=UPI003D159901